MKTVLFVCVHNAGRSQMAEAFTNRISAELHLPVRALSAGTVAGERINPVAQAVMAEIGIPLDGQSPKQLTQQMADQADRIITMGCGVDADACPARIFVSEDWGLEDPAGQPIVKVRQIRDQIRERVEGLLEAMVEAEYKDGQPGIPVVCNPAAFDATQQQRHRELISRLKKAVQEIHDLSDGYTFRFPAEPEVCQAVMEFATLERLCCAFLTFRLELAPQGGPLVLSLTGPEGTREILRNFLRGNNSRVQA